MGRPNTDFSETNRKAWNERARLHPDTEMYREAFAEVGAKRSCLTAIEERELGRLEGQRVLHLQCHLGQDTLSLLHLGAREAVGVDYSSDAVAFATSRAKELGLPARFIESEVLKAPEHPELRAELGRFDLVFASHGVFVWIGDLEHWYRVAAKFIRPGGRLYVADDHPICQLFDNDLDPGKEGFELARDYFLEEAERFDETGSYADQNAATEHTTTYEWFHRVGDHVTAAAAAGLRIEFFHEHQEAAWSVFPGCAKHGACSFRLPAGLEGRVPLTFSMAARRI